MKKLMPRIGLLVTGAFLAFLGAYFFAAGGFRGEAGRTPGQRSAALPAGTADDESGYRIKLMEEIAPEKGWKEDEEERPETKEEVEGALVTRRPLGEVVMAIVADGSARMDVEANRRTFEEMNAGLVAFLEDLPAGIAAGARTMGGKKDASCADSVQIKPVEAKGGLLGEFSRGGPRNLTRAVYLAAGDLAVKRGRKGIVVMAAGEEECGEWPCESAEALYHTRDGIRTFVLKLEPPHPEPSAPVEGLGEEAVAQRTLAGAEPEKSADQNQAPPFGSPVAADQGGSLSCIGRTGGGFLEVARSREEVAAGLRKAALDLSRNITVRLFRAGGMELEGQGDPRMAPWRVEITSLNETMDSPVASDFLPARFNIPPGRYRVAGVYGEATAAVSALEVNPGEEIEVKLDFSTGQLLVTEGAGWVKGRGGECVPKLSVIRTDEVPPPPVEKCGVPNRFVLSPGKYTLDVREGDEPGRAVGVEITAGVTAVVRVSPDAAPELVEE